MSHSDLGIKDFTADNILKISVITATYNSGATLRDTMESVLAQEYADYEHIIIDGNSTDNTLEIVRELAPLYTGRLKWLSEPDKGIYDAMNKGIVMATGDVIGILNSDDFFTSPNILKAVVDNISDVDAVYGDIHYVNSNNLDKCVRYYSSRGFRRWKMLMGFMPAHPSFYCRRSVYSHCGLFDLNFRVAADFEQLLRMIYVNRIDTKYLSIDFVTMRTGGISSSGFQSHKKIIKDHLLAYRKNKVNSNIALESIRYLYRVFEIFNFKIKTIFS